MKKILLALLGAITLASISSAQTNVVLSRNAVGYIRIEAVRSNLYQLANTFYPLSGANSAVSNVLGSQVPIGSIVSIWNPISQTYVNESRTILGWSPGTNLLTPGRGFWLKIPNLAPSNSYTVFLMGEVPDRFTMPTSIVAIANGFNLIAFPYPVTDYFTNTPIAKAGTVGDNVFFWDPSSNSYSSASRLIFGWSPTNIVLSPGQAFWYKRQGPSTNVQVAKPYTWP